MSDDTSCKLSKFHVFTYENVFLGVGFTFPTWNRIPSVQYSCSARSRDRFLSEYLLNSLKLIQCNRNFKSSKFKHAYFRLAYRVKILLSSYPPQTGSNYEKVVCGIDAADMWLVTLWHYLFKSLERDSTAI